MSLQHTHTTTPFSRKRHPLVLVCDGVSSPANLGSLFRLSDAFGVQELIICNTSIDLSSNRLRRTARSTETKVPYRTEKDTIECLKQLQVDNFQLIGLEITSESRPIDSFKISEEKKTALVIGNEQFGISDKAIELLHASVHIRMFGENSSMNVATAAGIALYEFTKNGL